MRFCAQQWNPTAARSPKLRETASTPHSTIRSTAFMRRCRSSVRWPIPRQPLAFRSGFGARCQSRVRGHAHEGRQYCIAALSRTDERPGTPARPKALHASGTLVWCLGDITVARTLLEQALALSRDLDNPME
jgi:hypothetical protein